jgi:DNA-binding GntR family transcriptional regulator
LAKSQASECAYTIIRRAIIEGTYQEGDRLVEAELATLAGVSRTPIREALRRLAAEGFVQVRPGSGAVVTRWSRTEMVELFEIRAALECLGAGLAAQNAGPDDIAALEDLCTDMERVATLGGPAFLETFSKLNTLFHNSILEISGNPRLAEMASGLMKLGVIMRTYKLFDAARISHSLVDHRSLVSAIKSGSVTRAESTMRSHILSSIDTFATGDARAVTPKRKSKPKPRADIGTS